MAVGGPLTPGRSCLPLGAAGSVGRVMPSVHHVPWAQGRACLRFPFSEGRMGTKEGDGQADVWMEVKTTLCLQRRNVGSLGYQQLCL